MPKHWSGDKKALATLWPQTHKPKIVGKIIFEIWIDQLINGAPAIHSAFGNKM